MENIKIIDTTKAEILDAIKKAKNEKYVDNLRNRNPVVAFDSKVRGNLGETMIKRMLQENEIVAETVPYNPKQDRNNIDLTVRIDKQKQCDIEIKTSLKPSSWCRKDSEQTSFSDCLAKGDIKIYLNSNANADDAGIVASVKRNAYIQLYFDDMSKQRDVFTIGVYEKNKDILSRSAEEIYEMLNYKKYLHSTIFAGWNSGYNIRKSLLARPLNDRLFFFDKKKYLKCPLSECHSFDSLVHSIQKEIQSQKSA